MGKVILEPAMLARLNGTDVEQELATPDGTTVGFFVPPGERARLERLEAERDRFLNLWMQTQVDEVALAKSKADTRFYTTDEVIRHLESL